MNEGHILIAAAVTSGFIAVLGFLGRVLATMRHLERKFDFVMIEHEMLILDLAERKGIPIDRLPTRSGRVNKANSIDAASDLPVHERPGSPPVMHLAGS